ncbi:MAG: molybdenum cofactor guanylyltransferase [Candidatus Poseidoniaceae archaeon]
MLTGIILAGGKSSRMGQDKSLINSNVSRLANELRLAGCSRVVVMCGTIDRMALFDEECVIDSKDSLAESLYDFISELSGQIQLASCDAYLADADLFSKIDGVPTDDLGNRQPLLAKIGSDSPLRKSVKISEMFQDIQSCDGGMKARNTNTPEELKEILSRLN